MSNRRFLKTRWSLVSRANAAERETATRALGELCEIYWVPLFAFARRGGCDDGVARDLVQSFCTKLLEQGGLTAACVERGRFRNYLLRAFEHFVANQHRHDDAAKRGGGVTVVLLDETTEHQHVDLRREPDPRRAYERQWALTLLERANRRLRQENEAEPKRALLRALEPQLAGEPGEATAAEVATQLGTTDGAVRVALHRLRTRLGELIREEVAHTVDEPAEIEDELRTLRVALSTR